MAVSTMCRFGNGKVVGMPLVGSDFNKFEQHATPRHQIGWGVQDVDGNVYRYSHFGASTNRGLLVGQDLSESSYDDTDNVILASASCQNTTDCSIGSKFVEITLASITKNQFAGGKLIITDDAGEGYTYDIVGNTATGTPASGTIRIELVQKLQVALTAASDFCIVGSRFANLEAASGTDCFLAGVTCSTVDVTTKPFAWVQTKGTVGILTAAVSTYLPAVGSNAVLSDVTSGAVKLAVSVVNDGPFMQTIVAADDTGHGAYYINL